MSAFFYLFEVACLHQAMEFQKEFPTCLLHTLKKFSCHMETWTTSRSFQL